MKFSAEKLKKIMSGASDEELSDILHDPDYTQEAVEAASEEFSQRHPDAPKLSSVAIRLPKVRAGDRRHTRFQGAQTEVWKGSKITKVIRWILNEIYGLVLFAICFICLSYCLVSIVKYGILDALYTIFHH
jgi:hypothetical protein